MDLQTLPTLWSSPAMSFSSWYTLKHSWRQRGVLQFEQMNLLRDGFSYCSFTPLLAASFLDVEALALHTTQASLFLPSIFYGKCDPSHCACGTSFSGIPLVATFLCVLLEGCTKLSMESCREVMKENLCVSPWHIVHKTKALTSALSNRPQYSLGHHFLDT